MQSQQEQQVSDVLARTRSRWVARGVVNRGGRWAILPGAMVAAGALLLWSVSNGSYLWMALMAALGCGGVAAVLLREHSRRRRQAELASPEVLLLDRSLRLGDALPAYVESSGPFRAALQRRVATALTPGVESAAVARRNWLPLAASLLLALLPLALWPRDETEPPAQIASEEGVGNEDGAGSGSGETGEGSTSQDEAEGESTENEGSSEGSSEGSRSEGGAEGDSPMPAPQEMPAAGANDAPEGAKPEQSPPSDQPQPGEAGDQPEGLKPPVPEPKPEIQDDMHRIKPEAGEGETTEVDRSRWVYNPDGAPLEGSAPRPPDFEHGGERVIPRTKVTSRERRVVEELYRKLFE